MLLLLLLTRRLTATVARLGMVGSKGRGAIGEWPFVLAMVMQLNQRQLLLLPLLLLLCVGRSRWARWALLLHVLLQR